MLTSRASSDTHSATWLLQITQTVPELDFAIAIDLPARFAQSRATRTEPGVLKSDGLITWNPPPMQRLELIINSLELGKVLSALDHIGVNGYTIIRNVIGKGSHGKASDDLEATTLSNAYVLVICPDEQVPAITTAIQPILQRYGGICWQSTITQVFP